MPNNLGFTLSVKNTQGNYIPLYPNTIQSQVIDWEVGEVYGPYTLSLPASGWSNNQQTVVLPGISPNNIPFCVKVLSGTASEMIAQDQAYSLLDPLVGIESLENQVRFTCTNTVPAVDLQVQIYWTA